MTESKVTVKCSRSKCPEYILIKYKDIIDPIYTSIVQYLSSPEAGHDLRLAKDVDGDWTSEIKRPNGFDKMANNRRAFHLIMNHLHRKVYIAKHIKILSLKLNDNKIRIKYYWNYW